MYHIESGDPTPTIGRAEGNECEGSDRFLEGFLFGLWLRRAGVSQPAAYGQAGRQAGSSEIFLFVLDPLI